MKNPLLTILTLSALALATAPFAEAAYMEGGKPVTKRHQAEPKKSLPEEKIQEKAPEPGAEKPKEAEAAPEKTKETPPPLAETKPQVKPVPAALPPPVPVAGEKEETPLGPDDANAEPGPKYAKEETAPPADEKKEATKRHPWSVKPVPGEKDETRNVVPEKKKGPLKNTISVGVFHGLAADDVEVDVSGLTFGYDRILMDSRCAECGLGNVLSLAFRLGFGEGESEDEGRFYRSYDGAGMVKDEITLGFATVGLRWQHQLGRNVAFVLGIFGGLEYQSVKWNSQEYSWWGSGYSRNGEESGVSFCYGGNAALLFEFGERHGIELGMDYYASSADFDDVPGWEAPVWIMARIGYRYSF